MFQNKLRKITLTLYIFILTVVCCKAQDVYTMSQTFTVNGYGELNYLEVKGFLPRDVRNKQKVIDIRLSDPRIKKIDGKTANYFRFKKEEAHILLPIQFKVEYDIILYDYDLKTIKNKGKHYQNHDTLKLKQYLKSKRFHKSKNKKIQLAANKITGDNELKLVENIFNFVIDTLKYDNSVTENIGAVRVLKTGLGDCTEYADLMVTLCRAKGIPARVISGVLANSSKNPNHNWCEVYLKEYGWVSFDPTLADNVKTQTTFYNLKNNYIYFTNKREDNKLASKMWTFRWRGKKPTRARISCEYFALNK